MGNCSQSGPLQNENEGKNTSTNIKKTGSTQSGPQQKTRQEEIEPKSKEPVEPVTETVTWVQVHSAIRWNKSLEEISGLLKGKNAHLAKDGIDPGNGNTPLHIAAQNGHTEICAFLLESCKCDVNIQNSKGQTPLHMAVEFGVYYTIKVLLDNGASKDIVNEDGNAAKTGIEGKCSIDDPVMLLNCATNIDMVKEGLKIIGAALDAGSTEIDKGSFIALCMGLRKKMKEEWTPEVNSTYVSLAKRIGKK